MEDLRIRGILWIWNVESGVHNWDVMATAFVKLAQERLALIVWESVLVIVKIPVLVHVVNIIPVIYHVQFAKA